jgi:hypothetical protein
MSGNKAFWFTVFLLGHLACRAGGDTTAIISKLVLSVGGGPVWHPAPVGVPSHLQTTPKPFGSSAFARVMWHPRYLLRVGIESGYTHLYRYSIDGPGPKGSVGLSAIPILLQWSMRVSPRLEAYAGWGTYRLTSSLEYLGKVSSSFFSQGYVAAFAFRQPLHDRTALALELKYMNSFVTGHHLLALQIRLDGDLLKW